MPFNDFDYEELTKTLTDNFNVLADEVQLLSDRKTILEHKLRFAHEQVRQDITSFLLQTPPSYMMKILSSRSGAAQAAATTDTPCILNLGLRLCVLSSASFTFQ